MNEEEDVSRVKGCRILILAVNKGGKGVKGKGLQAGTDPL